MPASPWRVLARPAFDVDTEASCGTSVAEAREALGFWRARLKRLPWYRRAARAEAIEMAARWQGRLVAAELERWRMPWLTSAALRAVTWWGPRRVHPTRHAARLALRATRASATLRLIAVAATAVAVACVAMTVLVVVLLTHAV